MSAARLTVTSSGQGDARQVVARSRAWRDLGGLLLGAGAELDVEPAASEQHRDRGAPAAGADHRRLAQRRQPAEPLPLELDVRPDPVGDGGGEAGDGCSVRGKVIGRPARSFTLRGRIRQPRRTCSVPCTATGSDRRAGLERQAADAALRRPERAGPDPGALGEDANGAAALDARCARSPSRSRRTARGGSGTRRARERIHPCQRRSNSSTLATYCIGRRHGQESRRSRTGRGSCGGWRRRSGRP